MVNFIKLLGLWAILLFSMVSAGKLKKHQSRAWFAAKDYLETAHGLLETKFRTPTDFEIPKEDIKKAWEHAYSQDKGSLYMNQVENHPKTIYTLTKIPQSSELGRKWGLDNLSKNAYLFWEIKKNKEHKFLAAQTWSVGGLFVDGKKLQEVVEKAAKL
ncbi:hypothetical protein NDA11_007265 [Ustilago hordei]|uniref:Conserved uncharacterized protein n=1 Tax=Ustilago hordei TaxID=120017 RepID=I2FZL7_USTHO|nr:uncharacterized protein UHO2_03052 [Ustilago hordei]KAJ1576857.1 hypothetical protein NDA15_001494 [Ustilago hordei]KAJ1578507.1 hypothetical protein NDA12_000826 [Ustilago hordei]KAJ1584232.1 hypothetical protein NDA11_007265 [Ustilago hordei]CCF52360.1 conserved uncharacterized protein [Ustilago hordei]SYW83824.1 uncharacterized protein UHO2_03052 [Ustilago hordei]